MKGHIVTPTKDIYTLSWDIPQGTMGVVTNVWDEGNGITLAWVDCEGLNARDAFGLVWEPTHVILAKRNRINFEQLYKQYFSSKE